MEAAATPFQLSEQPRVGDTFTTPGRTVTEADIVSFATQTGDLHPLHVDAEWSSGTRFGERIAPGALVLAYTIGLVRLNPERAMALKRIDDVLFTRPVKIGDTLTAGCRVSSIAPSDPGTSIVSLVLSTSNQNGRTVCRARLQVKWNGELSTAGSNGRRGE